MAAWKRVLGFDSKESAPAPPAAPVSPWQAATTPAPDHDDVFAGFATGKRRRSGHTAWVWLRNIAVALIVLAGINQLVIHPLRDLLSSQKKAPPVQVTLDLAAAGGIAAGFATDYLSYGGPDYTTHRHAALAQWVAPGADAAVTTATWSGEAILRADSPIVQSARAVGEDAASIAVLVRVQAYSPTGAPTGGPPPATTTSVPAPPTTGAPAFTPPVPSTYAPSAAMWLRLIVPITTSSDGRLVVASSGPVFSGDSTEPVESPGTDTDAAAATRLEASALKILTSYAAGDLQYITAPGTVLVGMSGQLTVTDVSDIDVQNATEKPAHRTTQLTVTWQLTGIDAAIAQTYGLLISHLSTAPVLHRLGVLSPTPIDRK